MIKGSSHLKSCWQQPLGSNISRLEFIGKHGIDISLVSLIEWPSSIFALCDFAEKLHTDAVIMDLERFLKYGNIPISKLTNKKEAPKNVDRCIFFINKTYEPIVITSTKQVQVYNIYTRKNSYIVDLETATKILTIMPDINDKLFGISNIYQ